MRNTCLYCILAIHILVITYDWLHESGLLFGNDLPFTFSTEMIYGQHESKYSYAFYQDQTHI